MQRQIIAAGLLAFMPAAFAQETPETIAAAAYDGLLGDVEEQLVADCDAGDNAACFGAGLSHLVTTYEDLSQAIHRHGGVIPENTAADLLLGLGMGMEGEKARLANPDPEPLSYDQFRAILEDSVASLDIAHGYFLRAGESGDYVIHLDPLQMRVDIDGDGEVSEGETFALIFAEMMGGGMELSPKQQSKDVDPAALGEIGFDRADAIWFAGYTQVAAVPFDWALAHDFSIFFNNYFHRFFPEAGLLMQDHAGSGSLFMDAESDRGIVDLIVAIHTANFPVTDAERLKGVLDRMSTITALSRQNWEAILAETDDDRELVPSPTQTSLIPGHNVTEEVVDAWLETLDVVDEILAGELLIPHWRFDQGFDLKVYFETATVSDFVMIFAGQGALPFLADGPIADAESFAAGNAVFGENWPNFIVWFN